MFCSRCGIAVQNTAKFCPSCGLDLSATTPLAAVPDRAEPTEVDVVRNALKDEYESIEELGRGGMAIVFRARDKHLDRDVAIKVLPFSLAFDAEFVERFQREARTSAKVEHPNIIPIYRVGRSGRVIFFVMKYMRGESLSEIVARRGQLVPDEISRILVQTASALGYAHKNGIVHRDIKPDNIMFDELGHAVVTDFGIAKAASGTRLTGTGMSIGTPHYMSPEQARAQPLDGRSDIYSLGVVAYKCLTGSFPFDGEDSFTIGYKHIMEELPEPAMQTAEQRWLFQVIKQMMAKSPDDRFQSAQALVETLEGKGAGATTGGREAALSAAATTVVAERPRATQDGIPGMASPTTPTTPLPGTPPTPEPGEKKEKNKTKTGMLVGMVVLLLVGGGGVGGYWYFFLDAQWPPLFTRSDPTVVLVSADILSGSAPDPLLVAGPDSSQLAAADSGASMGDSAAAEPVSPAAQLPDYGTLVIRAPEGARVRIDGDSAKEDSLRVDTGPHVIEAERPGYEAFRETIRVGRGQTTVVVVSMTRLEERRPEPLPAREPVTTRPRRAAPPPTVNLCAQDTPGAEYFRTSACYDSRPSTVAAPILTVPATMAGAASAVELLVKVSSQGRPTRILRGRNAAASQVTLAAIQFARDSMRYNPALKDGEPVEAWLRVLVRIRRRQ